MCHKHLREHMGAVVVVTLRCTVWHVVKLAPLVIAGDTRGSAARGAGGGGGLYRQVCGLLQAGAGRPGLHRA